jgi:hypothetical protein
MDANFKELVQKINEGLLELSAEKTLELGVRVARDVTGLLGNFSIPEVQAVIDEGLLKLPNSERQDPWFHPHPWMRGERSAFDLVDADTMPIQAKFYWLQKRGNAYVAGGVHFTKNWEDHDFTRTDEFKIGVDFFLTQEAQSLLVVLSNRGKLRVMELEKKISHTQMEIFEKWFDLRNVTEKQRLHTSLWESFKLQSVNAKFYDGVANAFAELQAHLKRLGKDEEASKLFSSRLLGRLIFVWFLRKMGVISDSAGYFNAAGRNQGDFYRQDLERLFFRTLNTPIGDRTVEANQTLDMESPYLNGGLFAPHEGDWLNDSQLSFPETFFERLIEHFENFNFTTDESTPEYEQVAIDPEMLGRVFESLLASQISATGEIARKARGAFYTPREVVAYMCKESVRSYLLKIDSEDERLRKAVGKLLDTSDQDWAIAGTNSLRDIPNDLRSLISSNLTQIKSLDPACGSGAFPLGLVQLLSRLHLRLDPRLDEYKLKLSILRDNIFGVDIEPMAIEISRLRAWLSLIVEERRSKQLEPLPNLDFNFVSGNSLVALDGPDLFTDETLQVKLSDLRSRYFMADSPSKKADIQKQYRVLTEPGLLDSVDARASQLKTFNPFDGDQVASFFDAEHMFGVTEGFDIVVGNPPYIGMKGHAELFDTVKNSSIGKRFFSGKMDYLYFFFHLGLDLLKKDGVMALITTNYWPTASYAKKLVEDLRARSNILKIVNFNEVQIFDSAAGQHNMITFVTRGSSGAPAEITTVQNSARGKISVEELSQILGGNHSSVIVSQASQEQLFKSGTLVLSGADGSSIDAILDVLQLSPFKLGNHAQINQGVVTGANKISASHVQKFHLDKSLEGAGVFIISRDELEALNLDAHEMEIVKPYFKNSDIRPWVTSEQTDKFLIYADERAGSLESRPKIRAHLEAFKPILEVGRSSKFPYLTWPRSVEFDGPKIVAPQRSRVNTFGYNEQPWYATSDVYYITSNGGPLDLFTLLGLLNSDLYLAWFYLRGKRKGEMMELFQMPLVELPLPKLTNDNSQILHEIGTLAQSLWSRKLDTGETDTQALSQLNAAVMRSFGFGDSDLEELGKWKADWQLQFNRGVETADLEEADQPD